MPSIAGPARLRAEIDALADVVESVDFGLAAEGQADRRARRDHLTRTLRGYLEPRLAAPDGPLVVAVFGPTGSGKSTIVNTLAGRTISRSGVLRPTTRQAVAWVHERHAGAFALSAVAKSGPIELAVDVHPALDDLVIVDTPDIDSIAEEHRVQTAAILAASDVAIAVTTPQRYADAVPWDVLADLTERALDVIVVMNRASRRSSGAVADLVSLLRDAKVGGIESVDDVTVVQEQRVRADGRLHGLAMRQLARRLQTVAAERPEVARRGLAGAGRHAVEVSRELAEHVKIQAAEGAALGAVVDEAVASQQREISTRLEAGELVRDEVVLRWQRMVGVSDLASLVTRGLARARNLVAPGRAVDETTVARVDSEVREELVELGMRRAQRAKTAVEIGWSSSPAGEALLSGVVLETDLVRAQLRESVAEWQSEVVALVAKEGKGRFRVARAASVGINAAATLLLLGVFASTGGLTGAEVGVAAGAAAAQQTLLERLFGSAAATRLARTARQTLTDTLQAAVVELADPFREQLANAVDDPESARDVLEAAERVAVALERFLSE